MLNTFHCEFALVMASIAFLLSKSQRLNAIYLYQEKDSHVYVITTIVYLCMTNLLLLFYYNYAMVISFFLQILNLFIF